MEIAKFLCQSILNPSIFFAYLLVLAKGSLGSQSTSIFGINAFERVSSNVYSVNPLLFIPIAVALYYVFLSLNYAILHAFNKNLTLDSYKATRLTWWSLFPCSIGGINLLAWFSGMEGNIAAVLFALPMLGAMLVQLIQLVLQNLRLLKKKEDRV